MSSSLKPRVVRAGEPRRRPLVVNGLSFLYLSIWNVETLPEDFGAFDLKGIIILVLAFIAVRRKMGVINLLAASGVLGLVLGLL